MSSALKKLVLVLLLAVLPLQGFAALVTPLCRQEPAASAFDAAAHPGGHDHDHEATTPDRHPPAAGDSGSDHCGTASAFAIPVMAIKLPAAPGPEYSLFLATPMSGHIPEQAQRPPRAVLL